MAKAKTKCPECGHLYSPNSLYSHLRAVHGIYGGRTGVSRQRRNGMAADVHTGKRAATAEPVTMPTHTQVANNNRPQLTALNEDEVSFEKAKEVLLRGSDGQFWIARPVTISFDVAG